MSEEDWEWEDEEDENEDEDEDWQQTYCLHSKSGGEKDMGKKKGKKGKTKKAKE